MQSTSRLLQRSVAQVPLLTKPIPAVNDFDSSISSAQTFVIERHLYQPKKTANWNSNGCKLTLTISVNAGGVTVSPVLAMAEDHRGPCFYIHHCARLLLGARKRIAVSCLLCGIIGRCYLADSKHPDFESSQLTSWDAECLLLSGQAGCSLVCDERGENMKNLASHSLH